MIILRDKCSKCGKCARYCPMNAISLNRSKKYYEVDLDKCVECYNCYRQSGCKEDALYCQKLVWPRTIRNLMSDELAVAEESGISGRGTEEMKTNEVTARFGVGEVGIGVEMGRHGVSPLLVEVEKVAMKLAELDVEFEPQNPITSLIEDKKTGKFKEEVLQERCLSAIIEIKTDLDKLPQIIEKLREASEEINTVFSLCVASKLDENMNNPVLPILDELGVEYRPNSKNNVGLGRPLALAK